MTNSNGSPAQSAAQIALGPPSCSEWSRSQGLDPVGTAGFYQGFILIEQPLPWPFDVSAVPELAEVAKTAMAAGFRVQMVVPVDQEPVDREPADQGGGQARRVICYRSARPGWAGPLVRSEGAAEPAEPASLVEAVAGLLGEDPAPPPPGPGSDASPGDGDQVIDLLVCTHGRRDACCGAQGMALVSELSMAPLVVPESAPSGRRSAVRLWRTSHTGGHRFAPTAVLLPSATMWAFVRPELLRAAAFGAGEAAEWLGRYRGCATLGPPYQQAVERAVLAEVGWGLIGSWRRASDLGDGLVRLESERSGTWEATVREGRRVPQPECRTAPESAKKQSVEWVVEGLHQVVPA